MANDQFSIPNSAERPLEEALRIADATQYTPESQPSAFALVKRLEERSHGYRRTALEIEDGRDPTWVESILGGKRPKVTLESLIDQESHIGGRLFGPTDRFWLSHKGSSVGGNHLGDWYHVRETVDAFGRKTDATLHFETHPDHVLKLHNGRPVEPTLEELETFVRAVELYEARIRAELYPFDQEIYDLEAEIEAESNIPDTVVEMFGETAVRQIQDDIQIKL